MNTHPLHRAIALALALPFSLAAGCGGGSAGGGQLLAPAPAPAPAPPPPQTPPPAGPCPMPISADCVIGPDASSPYMGGGRDSEYGLRVEPTGYLQIGGRTNLSQPLAPGSYRFARGTTVAGYLSLAEANTLVSDVAVLTDGDFWNAGLVRGNIDNNGGLWLGGTVEGHVDNDSYLHVLSGWPASHATIRGNFRQSAAGVLDVSVPTVGYPDYTYTLEIAGQAHLGGTLQLRSPGDGWDAYPLPNTPTSAHVLHAGGGVFGTFDRWTSPGLFITGSLRYGSNDVWFDLTRISVQAAMAAQGFGGITLASAGNLEGALAAADGFGGPPGPVHARFVRSVGSLLWIGDSQQAARSLDSLSGSTHADLIEAIAGDDVLARGIGARTLALQSGDRAGAWSRLHGGDTIAGLDQWLSPRLLVGASAAQAGGWRRDAMNGHSQDDSQQAALYLRWFGSNGWYAGGSAGYARHVIALDRRIDLAQGGQWNAHAQRLLGIASFDAEAGRSFSAGGVGIAPYAWLGADGIRSERALEQGQTGLELALQASTRTRLDAGLGLRVGKRWRVGDTGWLTLDADARYRRRVLQSGAPLRAAFVGVPDVWFDVPRHEARDGGWLDLGLRGGFGHRWAWTLGHAGSLAGQTGGRQWEFGIELQL